MSSIERLKYDFENGKFPDFKPEGPFVLITFEGDEFLFDDRHNVVKINGEPKKMDVKRNYFESDLGEGKRNTGL